jgi:MSHA pilin protein MshC
MCKEAGQVAIDVGIALPSRVALRLLPLCGERQSGFTLAEMIAVIVIVGILAAVAVPRFFDNATFQARAAADNVIAALRFGQKVAIAQHRNVDVNISSAADTNCATVLTGGNVNCAISNSVPVAAATVTFNALGQRTNATASVTIGTTTINIEAETGYVH